MRKTGLMALAAVAVLVAIVVGASQLSNGSSGGLSAPRAERPAPAPAGLPARAAEEEALLEGAPNADASVIGRAPVDGEQAPPLPQVAGRKIIRIATLMVEVEEVGAAVQEVERVARGAGGFVAASSVFVEERPERNDGERKRAQSATVTIRVPAEAYAGVMSQLRGIAEEVTSESSEASDVTEEFADLAARLRNLEATEARYLELLQKAESIGDILTVQDRINSVRLEIERIQGRINLLNDLSDLATITVHLRPVALVVAEPDEPGWAQEAWDNAWEASEEVLTALGTVSIVLGVVLAWLAVPALVIAIGWRVLGPRRERGREA